MWTYDDAQVAKHLLENELGGEPWVRYFAIGKSDSGYHVVLGVSTEADEHPVPYEVMGVPVEVRRVGEISALVNASLGLDESAETALGQDATTVVWSVVSMAAVGMSAYHGYKRNDSVGWAIAWALAGAIAPVITIPVAIAQGFGKPAEQ